ncbi:MAG: prepilin-type N-terminal cleavage/methylation domain-containing protein [Bacteroidales bacterium]|nr:prepilin-type N-terminal cleavage/methylation domain-containing protein [Bacteroidales bacterium]
MHTRLRPNRRAGISLIEAMIAIGILAIGLLSLLTLFPLGAIQIGQALKDDRCSETALQADAYIRAYWKRRLIEPPTGSKDQLLLDAGNDPDGSGPLPAVSTTDPGPGYPVYIDPIGYYTGTYPNLIGSSIHRLNLGLLDNKQAIRVCSLPDDLEFLGDGAPDSNQPLSRAGRYTWAAMVQRQPASTRYDLKVLVFDRRLALLSVDERKIVTAITSGATSVTIDTTGQISDIPLLRKGGWVFDATQNASMQLRKASFHRIAAVTNNPPGSKLYQVDLETPVGLDWNGAITTPPTYNAELYLLPDLGEVFDRPSLQDIP